MATLLDPSMFVDKLCSPATGAKLTIEGSAARCTQTSETYPIHDRIIDFVRPTDLDDTARNELAGNDIIKTAEEIHDYAHKYEADSVLGHYTATDIELIVGHLRRIGARELCCLGAGGGMEVKRILASYRLDRVYASDIVLDKCRVVPLSLEAFDVELGLFASDFDHCPWADTNCPVLIHQALHHTGEAMHRTLAALLERGFRHLILAEPTGNAVVRVLRTLGLAQRIEYSGVRPGRMQLGTARRLAKERGYTLHADTNWLLPKDYLHMLTRGRRGPEKLALRLVDGLSRATNAFQVGNNSVCCFTRN